MEYAYQIILIAATGGLVRNLIGFIKARMKHGDNFHPVKFVGTIIWGGIIGAVLTFFEQGYALRFATLEIILIAVAGTVVIDELLQAIFLRQKGGALSKAGAATAPTKAK